MSARTDLFGEGGGQEIRGDEVERKEEIRMKKDGEKQKGEEGGMRRN